MAADRLEALYRLAIASGLRQGELLGLRWQDVDLETRTLSVRHILQQGTRTLAEPKTDRSRRTIALDAVPTEALRKHRVRQVEERMAAGQRWQDGGFIFATAIGTPMHRRNLVRAFHAALDPAGIPRQPFHQLRHACATLLLESGEELANISKLLGHSSRHHGGLLRPPDARHQPPRGRPDWRHTRGLGGTQVVRPAIERPPDPPGGPFHAQNVARPEGLEPPTL